MHKQHRTRQDGFTLLEILIALTISAMVFGSIFSLLGGSKNLSFKASRVIEETLFQRSVLLGVNSETDTKKIFPGQPETSFTIKETNIASAPDRKTKPTHYNLVYKTISINNIETQVLCFKYYDNPRL